MSNVRRVYVEKKPAYAVQAKELKHEISSYLGIKTVTAVHVYIRYDVENISEEVFEKACTCVFSEPPVDVLYQEQIPMAEGARVFSVEYLPGQFDQRADSAEQCVKLLNEEEEPVIRTATTYVIEGDITEEQLEAIKHHCINPVDSRETGLEKPETLVQNFEDPADVISFVGFADMPEAQLKELYSSLNLAMTFKDFLHIQNYFKKEEHRDPSVTEIRVLDTYWSDHCRHTTFSTELKDVKFDDGFYKKPIEETYNDYLNTFKNLYEGRSDKFVCLMDIALLAMKRLKKEGIDYYLLTGSVNKEKRMQMVESFNNDDVPVFCISLKAGGTGLNLTSADIVIHYDPWWNVAAQNQATDRAYRIGQRNPVQVYKLIAQDTIEEKIVELQQAKQSLADTVTGGADGAILSMNPEQLLQLLGEEA